MSNPSLDAIGEESVNISLKIKEAELDFIRLIRDRLGIVIHQHQTKELHKTISEACHKFNCSPQDYLNMLTNCTDESPLLEHLIAGVTIGETYFFRDKSQMQLLQNKILPELILAKREQGNLSLRIWSAGSASGEEIYTIAMMLSEMLPDINSWSLHLLGTDINPIVLKKSIAGLYGEWSMRSIPEHYKKKYFTEQNQKYELSPAILKMVEFSYLNLNDNLYPSILNGTNAQDLILCRNVLIYFDDESIKKLMHKLSNSLVDSGYLLLGASDPVEIKGTNLTFHHREGLLFSRTTGKQTAVEKLSTDELKAKTSTVIPAQQRIASASQPAAKPPEMMSVKSAHLAINKFLAESRWQDVIKTVDNTIGAGENQSDLLTAKATALANTGKLAEATEACKKNLSIDSTNKFTHFTLAMILVELNKFNDAESALRKSIFLDHNFVVAHFQLGLLLLRQKQTSSGIKCLQNALNIATHQDATQPAPGANGLSYGRLAEILKNEITLYSTEDSNKEEE